MRCSANGNPCDPATTSALGVLRRVCSGGLALAAALVAVSGPASQLAHAEPPARLPDREVKVHGPVDNLAFSSDGKTLVVSLLKTGWNLLLFGDIGSNEYKRFEQTTAFSYGLAFCPGDRGAVPDSNRVVSSMDGKLVFWDVNTLKRCETVELGWIKDAAALRYSRDGNAVIFGGLGGTLRLFDRGVLPGPPPRVIKEFKPRVGDVAISPDGRVMAVSHFNTTVETRGVYFFSTPDYAPSGELVGSKVVPGSLSFSSDGKTLAVGGVPSPPSPPCVELWDVSDLKAPRVKTVLNGGRGVQFSPQRNNVLAALGSPALRVKLWNVDTQQAIATLQAKSTTWTEDEPAGWELRCIAFSPDDQFFVAGAGRSDGKEGYLFIWKVANTELFRQYMK